ncbi:Pc16g08610 [Penicillium rubens Wisconsin 54-1255]|jgi:serine/threonine-protein kinase SRPK3|uniref:non-specific serine/threonine protein kinase n=2 Tax=Penicillium chrysogenum species complex TaxID=254878 RepID=B6H7X7_PENRW|nr:Pc16g08610 [Penicillium rubens Wisconsin 54-1255]
MRNLIPTPFQPFRARFLLFHCKARRTQHYHTQFRDFSCIASRRSHTQGDDSMRHIYEPIEEVEKLESYRAGGYHPITIGDHIHSRYQVVHKLGHGTYSTIWLARDQKHNRYVAIKVCTADSNPLEFSVVSDLSSSQQSSSTSLGKTMIPLMIDRFEIQGPNGTHPCYVTAPARMSLSEAKDASYNRLFQLEVARALSAQLVLAVDYVHSQGFVHGDLHYGNVLLQLPFDLSQLRLEELYKKYGEPAFEAIRRFDGQPLPRNIPSRAVLPMWLGEASDKTELPEAKILLADFGEAFSPTKQKRFESHTPLVGRPPEARFEPHKPLSFPSDIWSLGCSLWEIIGQNSLFDGMFATADSITCEQVDALGILPVEWWYKWEGRHGKFAEDGTPINREGNPHRSWEVRFEKDIQEPRQRKKMPLIEPAEREAIFKMLKSMLEFRPEDRSSAKQILECEWMVRWALPEYEKIRGV